MGKSKLIILFLLLISVSGWAQRNRYMVFFKDKANNGYTLDNPTAFLSPKAIERRIRQNIQVTFFDLPISSIYVDGVRKAGAEVFFASRWMNGVLVQCAPEMITAIQQLSFVDRIVFVAPNAKLVSNGRKKTMAKNKSFKSFGITQTQLQMLGLDEMQNQGYKGSGVTVAIFDGGFAGVDLSTAFRHLFDANRITLTKDFVYNSSDVFQYDDHGTEVFSVISAYEQGVYTGGAYEANFQLYVTEEAPTEYRVEEYNWLFAAEKADSAGVDIIHSSLGYYDFDDPSMNYPKSAMNGVTTIVSNAAQMAADRGIVIVCSAGNEGNVSNWRIITAPADVVDALAVANVSSAGLRASTSSIGPAADGRIKPDVAALGTGTSVIKQNGATGTSSGTSLSAPLITSLVAGVWQRFPDLTNRQVIDAIRKSGSQALSPDNLLGYGIPNFNAVVSYLEKLYPQADIFEVYPNPIRNDTIIIKPFDAAQISECRIELISYHGQKIYEGNATFSSLNRIHAANVGALASGLYFVRIFWGEKKYTYKLVKI